MASDRSGGLLVRNLTGRVANAPVALPEARPIGALLAGLAACVFLMPALLPALMPLLVVLFIPVIFVSMVAKGATGPMLGCMGSLFRSGSRRQSEPRPGGMTFRLRTDGDRLTEVEFRGRPPRLELGDRLEISGLRIGSVVHVLRMHNTTTGERRVSKLAATLLGFSVLGLLVAASLLGS